MMANDEEIRAVENRLADERHALADRARCLEEAALDALLSPRGLLVAASVGFLIGKALHPSRSARSDRGQGIRSVLASAAVVLVRALGSSPGALARVMDKAAAMRARRAPVDATARRFSEASSAPAAPELFGRKGRDHRPASMQVPQSAAAGSGGNRRRR
jgi:hypothetical protein